MLQLVINKKHGGRQFLTMSYSPEEGMVVNAELPQLLATFIALHVEPNHALKHFRL